MLANQITRINGSSHWMVVASELFFRRRINKFTPKALLDLLDSFEVLM